MCSASFGKPRASLRKGNDDHLELQRAGNPHVVCTIQQLPARQYICVSRCHRGGVASQLAAEGSGELGNRTLARDPAGLAASSCQRTYCGQTEGRHGEDTALLHQWCQARVVQQKKYRDIGDKPIRVQVSLNPATYETCSWVLRK